jgi:hypothetical protein
LEKRGLRIIDGKRLTDEVQANLPSVLSHLSRDTQYAISVEKSVNVLKESSLAFGLTRDLDLDSTYVELRLTPSGELRDVLSFPLKKADHKLFMCDSEEAKTLQTFFNKWAGTHSAFFCPPRNRPATQRKVERLRTQSKDALGSVIVEANLHPVVANLQKQIHKNTQQLVSHLKNSTPFSDGKLSAVVREGIELASAISNLRESPPVRTYWKQFAYFSAPAKSDKILPPFSPKALLHIDAPIYVTGPPGAGKTTLLRRLAQELARLRDKQLPLFVPLIKAQGIEQEHLIQACVTELTLHGFQDRRNEVSSSAFLSLAKSGRFKLFLDGLDELGSNSKAMLRTIDNFSMEHSCPVVVSCRDTFKISWRHAFTVALQPLTDEQIEQFIRNWFTAEPSSQDGLLSWLNTNPKIREATRTPIIAGLMCSLYSARAEMPSSEIELYERRFELLLGRWEQAKHIPPLPVRIQKTYEHFLMKLAFHMHSTRIRAIELGGALTFAREYSLGSYLRKPGELIEDCIQRGLLEYETLGGLSFGHLTYQEYLAARWLAQDNDIRFVWSVLQSPWWFQTVDFYSTIKGDLTRLMKHALRYNTSGELFDRLCHLAKLAPFTSSRVLHQLKTRPRVGGLPYQGEK